VAHYSRVSKIVIDVPPDEHDRELAFWGAAAGAEMGRSERYPEYHEADLYGGELGFLVQRLGGGQARVHLDIHTDDLEAEVARLEALGAERVQQVHHWWVMRDPAGLPFCVIPGPAGSFTDANARRWD
jgi:hypothetical protein